MNSKMKTKGMSDNRKSIATLKAEIDQHRKNVGKTFIHEKSGENYQFLFMAFDEATNEILVIYALSSMPWLKFSRPPLAFYEKFIELGEYVALTAE